ncbi:hypothetical protein [Jatrophihabitans sp.]|jgi:hypothetical protein|uniref:hypothetical protein n=1 Tax=Jatrophihabitans sp. TaxID=1932789 RepID=UPI002F197659
MAQYFLHYGSQTFELADGKAAVELRQALKFAQKNRAGGDVRAWTTTGLVIIFYAPGTPVAISAVGEEASAPLDEGGAVGQEFA